MRLLPYQSTDAAEIGTAMHEAIEYTLECVKDGQASSLAVALQLAQDQFSDAIVQPHFSWVKTTEANARRQIDLCVTAWYDEVQPLITEIVATELVADQLTLWEDDRRVIAINGSIDLVGSVERGPVQCVDWKTSGQKYQQWEKQRWAMQPTVYTWAGVQLGVLDEDDEYPFTFFVMMKTGAERVQRVDVSRHHGDWEWMKQKARRYAQMLELDQMLPTNDTHALCSPTWCKAFSICKGLHYSPSWPKPSEPSGVGVHLTTPSGH